MACHAHPDASIAPSHPLAINVPQAVWQVYGVPPTIQGGQVKPTAAATPSLVDAAVIDTGVSDGVIAVDVYGASGATASGHVTGGLVVRWRDVYNYLYVDYRDDQVRLVKVEDNTELLLAAVPVPTIAGRVQRLQVTLNGPSIQVHSDGVLKIQAPSFFNVTATVHGLHWWSAEDAQTTFDHFAVRGTPSCVTGVSVSPVSAAGGIGVVSVTAPAACAWTAASDSSAFTLATTSGTGSATILFTALANLTAPNTPGTVRTSSIGVGGRTATVSQPAMPDPCALTLTPASLSAGTQATVTSVSVITNLAACQWTASAPVSWITVQEAVGTGSGTVHLSLATNDTGATRTSQVTVNGRTLSVTQSWEPAPCTCELWPASADWPNEGSSGGFDITAAPGCGWWVTTSAPWVHLANQNGTGVGGSGAGTVGFSVDASTSGAPRSTTQVFFNTIEHVYQHAFIGLWVGWFQIPNAPTADHSGIRYFGNSIRSGPNGLSFGLMVGQHSWGPGNIGGVRTPVNVANADHIGDSIFPNDIEGSVINLAVDGMSSGAVSGNRTTGHQGTQGFHCAVSAELTVGPPSAD